jgi:hypothetical protein
VSVKEVANRLLQVPQGAVLTLHFEVNTKNAAKNKSTSKRTSLFRRSNSNQNMLNPIKDKNYAPDHPFHKNKEQAGKRPPPSILKTPKYSSNSLTMGCSGGPSPMQMLMESTALHYRTARILHDEAILEFEQLGKFLTQPWSTSTSDSSSTKALTDASASLIEEINNRWARIRADELAEF